MAVNFTEYLSFQPPPGFRDELIHGEVILSPSANRKHADLCCRIYDLLKDKLKASFVVRLDTTHHLGEREGPRPDVFVISRDRWVAADKTGGFPEGSPELAIEVLSASNSTKDMTAKRDLYFSDPRCLEVWEVREEGRQLTQYVRLEATQYTMGHSVPIPGKLGDGSLAIETIFSGIIEP